MQVEAVIFDIGNVLIGWQPERYFDAQIGQTRRDALFAAVDLHGMMQRIDEGGVFGDVVEDTALAHPDWTAEIRWFRDHWNDMAGPEITHSVRLLRALRTKGVQCFALSNFGKENFPMSEAEFPFLTEFDRRYISGVMKLAKPDPAIYAAVEADCGMTPQALLFADDREENTKAAAARGWQTHLFTTPDLFATDLVARGLLTADEAQ
ncbi:MAG: HAD-IA family hydrolase [Pseudomonadota bacterium]